MVIKIKKALAKVPAKKPALKKKALSQAVGKAIAKVEKSDPPETPALKTKPKFPAKEYAKISEKNQLFYGDNIEVLTKYIKDETVDLCYIDPPFNSNRDYNQIYNNVGHEDLAQTQAFVDTWEWTAQSEKYYEQIITNARSNVAAQTLQLIQGLHGVLKPGALMAYLVSMTIRLIEIHRALKPTGSLYLHCDPTASHYLKLVIDSIFLPQGGDFRSEIVWRRTGAHNKARRWAPIHDIIFYYTKSNKFAWNKPKRPYMKGHVDEYFEKTPQGYRTQYYGNVLTGSGTRDGESGKPWRGFDPTAKGRHWAIPGRVVENLDEDIDGLTQHEKLDRLLELGYIKIEQGSAWPIYEHYLADTDGQPTPDIWSFQPYTSGTVFNTNLGIDEDVRWLSPRDQERLGYPTQKPEGLLERIITASSNEGDLILDAFCGCGTTVAVAHRLRRKWIGIDITYHAIAVILKRFEDQFGAEGVESIALNGIPRDVEAARALANKKDDKLRKEFEKWATLTYSNNRAVINDKKGADKGIDGRIFFLIEKTKTAQLVVQVKSGSVDRADVATLSGDRTREKAELAVLITLEEPTKPMKQEAAAAGVYHHALMNRDIPRVQIVTVQEILEKSVRLDLPTSVSPLKAAQQSSAAKQPSLL